MHVCSTTLKSYPGSSISFLDKLCFIRLQLPTGSILPLNQITTITSLPVVQPVLNRCAQGDM